jgi:hypothetical protein
MTDLTSRILRVTLVSRAARKTRNQYGTLTMRQNITLSIEKDLIIKAKILAARRQTSVSRMLSQEVEKLVAESEQYEKARNSAFSHIKSGFHLGGEIKVTREELHDRQAIR